MKMAILIVALTIIIQFLGMKVFLETILGGIALYLSWKLLNSITSDILKSCGGRIW